MLCSSEKSLSVVLNVGNRVKSLPVEAVNHIPHQANEVLVLLGAGHHNTVELLHVGVDGVQAGCLSTACKNTAH